jgi:hypothetical protein
MTHAGKPVAAVVPIEDLATLEALEAADDEHCPALQPKPWPVGKPRDGLSVRHSKSLPLAIA